MEQKKITLEFKYKPGDVFYMAIGNRIEKYIVLGVKIVGIVGSYGLWGVSDYIDTEDWNDISYYLMASNGSTTTYRQKELNDMNILSEDELKQYVIKNIANRIMEEKLNLYREMLIKAAIELQYLSSAHAREVKDFVKKEFNSKIFSE